MSSVLDHFKSKIPRRVTLNRTVTISKKRNRISLSLFSVKHEVFVIGKVAELKLGSARHQAKVLLVKAEHRLFPNVFCAPRPPPSHSTFYDFCGRG